QPHKLPAVAVATDELPRRHANRTDENPMRPAVPVIPAPAISQPISAQKTSEPPKLAAVSGPEPAAVVVPTPEPSPEVAPASISASQPPPSANPRSPSPKMTATVFQEIDVQRIPKFAILGAVTAQDLQYKLLSELTIAEPDEAGVRTV